MFRWGREILSLFNVIGHVFKRTTVRAMRGDDPDFRRFYANECGKNVDDIPEWRNAVLTGIASYDAFRKYAHPEPVLSDSQSDALAQAALWMHNEFSVYMRDSVIISEEAVIDGTEGGNSPGFPWNKYFDSCNEFYDSCDRVLLGEYWDRCVTRDGAFTVWNSFLKEELRKKAKIQAGDIRQINGCAVEFKIAMNRFCLEMNEKFYASHLRTASAVGINKYHGGWNRLYNILAKHEMGFSLDVKRWDSHFPRVLMELIREFRWRCLAEVHKTPDNRARFVNLYEQIIESITVMNWGELIQTRLGNPSGSPNTVVDNTLGLYIVVAYCFIRSARERGFDPTYSMFNVHISLMLYGDDNTFTGSDFGLSILNFRSMFRYAAELGFEITAGGCPDPRPVLDLDFLSSSFTRLANGFIACKPKAACKALASMAFRSDGDILTSWKRACSHRLNSFFEPEVFDVADRYCAWLMRIIDRKAESEGWLDEWKSHRSEYKPVRDIWWLHCSVE